jgi:signal peptidase I
VLTWVLGLVLVLVAGSVAGLLPLQVMRVSSGSMAPTIGVGDLVLVEKLHHRIHRLDVVAVHDPNGAGLLVKRVVAFGGESVGIEDGVLVVDGRRVCEHAVDPSRIDGVYYGPVTVPAGEVFLLGDERGSSIDSRDFGPVGDSGIVGLVRARFWPHPGLLSSDSC